MIPVHHIAATQMFFLIEGMNDAASRHGHAPIHQKDFYKRITDETQGGVADFVCELSTVIDTLTACVLVALESSTTEFPGVFEYEVASTIGDLLYETSYCQLPLSQDYRQLRAMIVERAHEFFWQMEKPYPAQLFPVFEREVARIERQLADGTYQFRGASR